MFCIGGLRCSATCLYRKCLLLNSAPLLRIPLPRSQEGNEECQIIFHCHCLMRSRRHVTPSARASLRQPPASVADLLLRFSKEARRRERADKSLFGRFCRNTWRSGIGALDSRQLARHLRRVLTLHHGAHAGGRGEAVNLRPAVTGFVTIQVRLGVFGT